MSCSNSEAYDSSSNVVDLTSQESIAEASARDAQTTILTDDKSIETLASIPNSSTSSPNNNINTTLPSPGREGQVDEYLYSKSVIESYYCYRNTKRKRKIFWYSKK